MGSCLFARLGEETGGPGPEGVLSRDVPSDLSVAHYLIRENRNTLSRFPGWAAIHKHPCGEAPLPAEQRTFRLCHRGDPARFFRLQGRHRVEREHLAYDTTSVSSYSQRHRQVHYGKNKSYERLALLFGQQSGLPFC